MILGTYQALTGGPHERFGAARAAAVLSSLMLKLN